MGFFDRKRTTYEDSSPLYTIGNSHTLLVIGLGNVGDEYVHTRHNIGFDVIDSYHQTHNFSGWVEKKDLSCLLATGQIGATRVLLAKPTTFMNLSGEAAQKIQKFYKIANSDTLVVHDELDVPFGVLRTRTGGGSAGHNGIKSLIALIGEDFGRIRVGIGPKDPPAIDSAAFVLQRFSKEQLELIPKIAKTCCALVDERTVSTLPEQTIDLN